MIDGLLPMDPFWRTLVLAAMPAAGALIGGLLGEMLTISRRTLSIMLHAVAGILLSVVGIELLPQALDGKWPLLHVGLFMAGVLFTLGLDWATDLTRRLIRGGSEERPREEYAPYPCRRPGKHDVVQSGSAGAAWVIFIGVAIDFITDGLMLVSGSDVQQNLGLVIGIALIAADSPEAFATISNMKSSGGKRSTRLWLAFSFPAILVLGALLGEWLLRGVSEVVQLGVLAFTAGIILTLVESQIIPETFEKWEGKVATVALTASFAGFALLSTWLGS